MNNKDLFDLIYCFMLARDNANICFYAYIVS